jgi:hypothetical protein
MQMRLLFFIFYVIVIFHFINDFSLLIQTWVNNIWGIRTMPYSILHYNYSSSFVSPCW